MEREVLKFPEAPDCSSTVIWPTAAPGARMERTFSSVTTSVIWRAHVWVMWSDSLVSLFLLPLLIPSFLCSLSHLFPSFYPSLEGEESGRFIKASVWGSGQEKASLPAFVPSHPRSFASRPGRRGNRSRPASAPPSPSRPLRFLPHGVAGASRLLSHREWHVGGHRAGAFAQEVGISGH